MKTVYYYQTFVGLDKLKSHVQDVDCIIISSLHCDKNGTSKQIYLNDDLPFNPKFTTMWEETQLLAEQGVSISLMIGGAGLAYGQLFEDFDIYYSQIRKLLQEKTFIREIDLDVEEGVTMEQIQKLIRALKQDFPYLIITMAPLSGSMSSDSIGMGGFSYKQLSKTPEGKMISRYHVQCYGSFSFDTFQSMVKNEWEPEQLVMGMMSGQFTPETFSNALQEVKKCYETYPTMGGVFDWEYLDAPPDEKDPSQWCYLMKQVTS